MNKSLESIWLEFMKKCLIQRSYCHLLRIRAPPLFLFWASSNQMSVNNLENSKPKIWNSKHYVFISTEFKSKQEHPTPRSFVCVFDSWKFEVGTIRPKFNLASWSKPFRCMVQFFFLDHCVWHKWSIPNLKILSRRFE